MTVPSSHIEPGHVDEPREAPEFSDVLSQLASTNGKIVHELELLDS
jgi:hypothetical protein